MPKNVHVCAGANRHSEFVLDCKDTEKAEEKKRKKSLQGTLGKRTYLEKRAARFESETELETMLFSVPVRHCR